MFAEHTTDVKSKGILRELTSAEGGGTNRAGRVKRTANRGP